DQGLAGAYVLGVEALSKTSGITSDQRARGNYRNSSRTGGAVVNLAVRDRHHGNWGGVNLSHVLRVDGKRVILAGIPITDGCRGNQHLSSARGLVGEALRKCAGISHSQTPHSYLRRP